MSKVDAQRALREARYAAMQAQARPARAAAATTTTTGHASASPKAAPAEELCGHRGSAGKPCVRPARHPEKSHRYA